MVYSVNSTSARLKHERLKAAQMKVEKKSGEMHKYIFKKSFNQVNMFNRLIMSLIYTLICVRVANSEVSVSQ